MQRMSIRVMAGMHKRTKDVLLNRMHKIQKKLTVYNRERKMTSKG